MTTTKRLSLASLAAYAGSIPAANWMISHVGTVRFPGGPHVTPVGLGYEAPSGVLMIGFALVARDYVQQTLGRRVTLLAIALGVVLSALVAPSLAVASAVAFGLGEIADFAVYIPLADRRLYLAVIASGIVGAIVDSLIFLRLAFHSTMFWQGNVLGKVWMSAAALPVLFAARALPRHATNA